MFIFSIIFSLIGGFYFYCAVANTFRAKSREEAIEKFGLVVPGSGYILVGISLFIDNPLLIIISSIYYLFSVSVGRAVYELVILSLFHDK